MTIATQGTAAVDDRALSSASVSSESEDTQAVLDSLEFSTQPMRHSSVRSALVTKETSMRPQHSSIFSGITSPVVQKVVSEHTLEDFTTALATGKEIELMLCDGVELEFIALSDIQSDPDLPFQNQSATIQARPSIVPVLFTVLSVSRLGSGGYRIVGQYSATKELNGISHDLVTTINLHLLDATCSSITYTQE